MENKETLDGTIKTPQQIIREHYQDMAKKSHKAVREKYGPDYYKRIQNKRWDTYRRLKGEQQEEKELVIKYVN